MVRITMLTEEGTATSEGDWADDHPVIPAESLPAALGWELRPQGLCRGDVCVPVADRSRLERAQGIDLTTVAELLHRPVLADAEESTLVIGVAAPERRRALRDLRLPPLALPDLDGEIHSLQSWTGHKKLLIAFASW